MISTKKCAECGRDLPLSEYNKNRNNKDGLQDRCRECFSKYNKARYAANKEKFKADIYAYKAENPDKVCETRLSTCSKNPNHYNANKAVSAALASGRIRPAKNCAGCGVSGDQTRLGAHHHDYSKPLDVVWVCAACHRRLDAERRKREGKKPFQVGKAVQMLRNGEVICTFESIADAARAVGCRPSHISDCLAGRAKTAKGSQWIYLESA